MGCWDGGRACTLGVRGARPGECENARESLATIGVAWILARIPRPLALGVCRRARGDCCRRPTAAPRMGSLPGGWRPLRFGFFFLLHLTHGDGKLGIGSATLGGRACAWSIFDSVGTVGASWPYLDALSELGCCGLLTSATSCGRALALSGRGDPGARGGIVCIAAPPDVCPQGECCCRPVNAPRAGSLPGGWLPLRIGLLILGFLSNGGGMVRLLGTVLSYPTLDWRLLGYEGTAGLPFRCQLVPREAMRFWSLSSATCGKAVAIIDSGGSRTHGGVARVAVMAEARKVARVRYAWIKGRGLAACEAQDGSRGVLVIRRLRVLMPSDCDTPATDRPSCRHAYRSASAGANVADTGLDVLWAQHGRPTCSLTTNDDGTLERPLPLPWTRTMHDARFPPFPHHGAPLCWRCPPPCDDSWTEGWWARYSNNRIGREEQEERRARVFAVLSIVITHENGRASIEDQHERVGQGGRNRHNQRITTTRRRGAMLMARCQGGDGLGGGGDSFGGDVAAIMPTPPRDPRDGCRRGRRQRAHTPEPEQTVIPQSEAGRMTVRGGGGSCTDARRNVVVEQNPLIVPFSSRPSPPTQAELHHPHVHLTPLSPTYMQFGLGEPRAGAQPQPQACTGPAIHMLPPSSPRCCPPTLPAQGAAVDYYVQVGMCLFDAAAAASHASSAPPAITITGKGPLGLRGGGPPPGAGVWEWLEDEEGVEERELSELWARRMEEEVLDSYGSPRPVVAEPLPGFRPIRITGEVGGKRTVVCSGCFRDFSDGFTVDCACGRAYCSDCRVAIICTCGVCNVSRSDDSQHVTQAPVTISL